MKTRILGKNGPALTEIGFGSWALGGSWIYGWGKTNDEESIRAIRSSLEQGVNWIDTAAVYGYGHSEAVVAKALKGLRKDAFVATKCGLISDGKGDVVRNSHPDNIRKEIEGSLRRLETECIDLYQIHWPDASVPYEESWGTMMRLQEEGKARYIGVSNYDVSMLERCRKVCPVQSLQPPYSMLTRDVERDTLAYCLQHDIGVIAYSPMQSGLLTGSFDPSRLAPDDWRRKSSWFQEPDFSRALAFIEALRPIANSLKATVGQLAVQWVVSQAGVTAAIVGARHPRQVDENIGAAQIVLSDEDLQKIRDLIDSHFRST